MAVDVRDKTDYLKAFRDFERDLPTTDPRWMTPIRERAIASFRKLGFPAMANEEWRYTNLSPIESASFRFRWEPARTHIALEKLQFGHPEWIRLVFVNGIYSKELSSEGDLGGGIRAGSLREAIRTDSIVTEQYLARYAPYERDAFTALNTAFIFDGAFIFIPKGKAIERPVHLLFVSHSEDGPWIAQPRNLIVAGDQAEATIVESFVSLEDTVYFNNSVTEIVLSPGSRVEYYKDQKESIEGFHIGTTQVCLERASRFGSTSIALGAKLSRHNLALDLDSEDAECDLKGIYFVTGSQHVDNHLMIDHKKPRGTSRQVYKGILDGHATGAFSGKIFIRRDAQKTDAFQVNKNLLLSEGARVDSKPQFEISADDVKATHGAAVGQLNEDEVFYLASRGMSDSSARALLTFGFASELVEKIKLDPIRWELDRIFWTRLQERGM